MYTVEQVHTDFLTAEDRLLNEAKSLIENPKIDAMKKAERLNKLGFTSSRDSKLAEDIAQKSSHASGLLSSIAHFRTYYPHNKFITEQEVKRLCEKYGLVLGGADRYVGDIPEKNVMEMERFKLRSEDFVKEESVFGEMLNGLIRFQNGMIGMDWGTDVNSTTAWGRREMQIPADIYGARESKPTKKPAFKMCAPAKEFNTSNMAIEDGYKMVVDDPIVLQPVKGGYLIVTAWGKEASDEAVVNGVNN